MVLNAPGATATFTITSGPTADYSQRRGVGGGHAGSNNYAALIASNHGYQDIAEAMISPAVGKNTNHVCQNEAIL